jgi:PPK2 family polyphosphate:nucleotide phosphotransferase
MKLDKRIKRISRLAQDYRIRDGRKFRLKDFDPKDTGDFTADDKAEARQSLQEGIEILATLQDMLYAQDRWAVLLIFQAMDAAGKDGAIKHVMSGINPQGCKVASFKAPSSCELDHDYLWRCQAELPERGKIGIFNRSYYEEVLVVRVHPELLARQKLPPELITKQIWTERFHDIRAYERFLTHNGVIVRKFFLYVSRREQKKRFLARIENPGKNWKFSSADLIERGFWKDYMSAYEEMIQNTASDEAPWYVVPADNKWYAHIVLAAAIIEALSSLDLSYPKVSREQMKQLASAKQALLQEK